MNNRLTLVEECQKVRNASFEKQLEAYDRLIKPLGDRVQGYVCVKGLRGWVNEEIAQITGRPEGAISVEFSRIERYRDRVTARKDCKYVAQFVPDKASLVNPDPTTVKYLHKQIARRELLLQCFSVPTEYGAKIRFKKDEVLRSLLSLVASSQLELSREDIRILVHLLDDPDPGVAMEACNILMHYHQPSKIVLLVLEYLESQSRYSDIERKENTPMNVYPFNPPPLSPQQAQLYSDACKDLNGFVLHPNALVHSNGGTLASMLVCVTDPVEMVHSLLEALEMDFNTWTDIARRRASIYSCLALRLQFERLLNSSELRSSRKVVKQTLDKQSTTALLAAYVREFSDYPKLKRFAELFERSWTQLTAA